MTVFKLIGSDDVPNWEPGEYRTPEARTNTRYLTSHERVSVNLRKDFGDTGVQCIFDISSIFLRPERPTYPGEEWHVQGQLVYDPHVSHGVEVLLIALNPE